MTASERITRPVCQCGVCELDRKKGRRQYVARWGDDYYSRTVGPGGRAPRHLATIFGVSHAATFGPHLRPLLVDNKAHPMTLKIRKAM